jgi:hypothetical protein
MTFPAAPIAQTPPFFPPTTSSPMADLPRFIEGDDAAATMSSRPSPLTSVSVVAKPASKDAA